MSDFTVEVVEGEDFNIILNESPSFELDIVEQVNKLEVYTTVLTGPAGADGTNGTNGQGVPTGGLMGQVLIKNSNADFDTTWENAGGSGNYVLRSGDTMTGSLFFNGADADILNLIIKNTDGDISSIGTRNIITGMTDVGVGSLIKADGRMNIISGFASGGATMNATSDNAFILAQISGTSVSVEATQPASTIRGFIGGADSSGMSAGAFAASATGYIGSSAFGSSITAGGVSAEASGVIKDSSQFGGISSTGEASIARGRVSDSNSQMVATAEVSVAYGALYNGGKINSTGILSWANGYIDGESTINAFGTNSFVRSYILGTGSTSESSGNNSSIYSFISGTNSYTKSSGQNSFINASLEGDNVLVEASGKSSFLLGSYESDTAATASGTANFINARTEGVNSFVTTSGNNSFVNAYIRGGGSVTVDGDSNAFFGDENGTATIISGKSSFGFGTNININNDYATVFGQGIGAAGSKSVTFGWDGVVAAYITAVGLTIPSQSGTPGMAYFDSSGNFFSAGATIPYQNTKRAAWAYDYNSYATSWTVNHMQGFNTYVGSGGATALLPTLSGDESTRVTIKHQGSGTLLIGTASSSIFFLDGTASVTLFRGQAATFAWNGGSWSYLDPNERKVYAAKIANYTIQPSDRFINVTANSPTITLHTAVSYLNAEYEIKNTGVGTVSVVTTASQTMDGVTMITLLPNQYLKVRSDNANWMITGRL